jgi:hypothetical protein
MCTKTLTFTTIAAVFTLALYPVPKSTAGSIVHERSGTKAHVQDTSLSVESAKTRSNEHPISTNRPALNGVTLNGLTLNGVTLNGRASQGTGSSKLNRSGLTLFSPARRSVRVEGGGLVNLN